MPEFLTVDLHVITEVQNCVASIWSKRGKKWSHNCGVG